MAAAEKRIVVTGLGTVTALGSGDQFWDSLIAGESGIDTITAFDASRFPTTIGAECKDFNAKACWPVIRRLSQRLEPRHGRGQLGPTPRSDSGCMPSARAGIL